MTDAITEDMILGGRVRVRQPRDGYRIAIDPIFLAAAINPEAGESILDVGAGVGAASLCLAHRTPHCRVTGLEMQIETVRLAMENVRLNQLIGRVEILSGDLLRPPPRLAAGTYAHVMANPPYFEAMAGSSSPHIQKATSHMETTAPLEQWVKFALLMTRPKGTVTFIYRADRLDHLLGNLCGKVGDIIIYPLWPGSGKPAKRVIVQGRKNSNGSLRLAPGLVLHNPDGSYTPQADAILWDGASLVL